MRNIGNTIVGKDQINYETSINQNPTQSFKLCFSGHCHILAKVVQK